MSLKTPGETKITRHLVRRTTLHGLLGCMTWLAVLGGEPYLAAQTANLSEASLEDLMNLRVTTASRKEQKLSKVAAAVYVITQEDIRRSGATNLPDLLRRVPGLDVAQITASTWAISARGFNGQIANKLLVLIDGRTVYDPLFSGVYWDAQDVVLEDIDRIEVIRGPGATVWGTNAVLGVINIITKGSQDTQGVLTTAGGGSQSQADATLRYGSAFGKRGHYRVFGKYFNRGSLDRLAGGNAADSWNMRHGGFRADWDLSDRDSVTAEGDVYGGSEGEPYPAGASLSPPFSTLPYTSITDSSGGNFLARWKHTLRGGSEITLQGYFDRVVRADSSHPELRSTSDVDFQHHLRWGSRQDIVWGSGYRTNSDTLPGSFAMTFNPRRFSSSIENAFFQDEIELARDTLWLTAGSKVEHNEFTGIEIEPNVRLLWAATRQHSFWLAYAKANRIPARYEVSSRANPAALVLPNGSVALYAVLGNPNLDSESLDSFEAGYRFQPDPQFSLDLATFYDQFSHLRTFEHADPFFEFNPPPPHLVIPKMFDNGLGGSTRGAELVADWKPARFWSLEAGYTWFQPSLRLEPWSTDTISALLANGESPRTQFQARSGLDLPHQFTFDCALYHVGRLAYDRIPSYTRADARIGWRLGEWAEFSIVGQNLLTSGHPEFNSPLQSVTSSILRRSAYVEMNWRH